MQTTDTKVHLPLLHCKVTMRHYLYIFILQHFQSICLIISCESPNYSYYKSNWKWQISKTIEVSEVPDMSKESLDSPGGTSFDPIFKAGLPLSENFDGLSLLGAEIFAFGICLENRTKLLIQFSLTSYI